ncbi:MAG: hypothetical protein R3181_12580 [Rubricoccaceae bacterium]|nr:hypothetical protein [Rubricoccaceae bacterium]
MSDNDDQRDDQSSTDDGSGDGGNGSGSGGDSDQDQSSDETGGDGSESEEKNWLEWVVTVGGAAIVLFVVGYFVYELIGGASGPADLRVSLGEPKTTATSIEVPVEIVNRGARVAEAAVVEVCAGEEQCAQITFDYVPYRSKVTGSVGFEPPLQGAFSTRVVSYRDP